jgi:hypothetical protein
MSFLNLETTFEHKTQQMSSPLPYCLYLCSNTIAPPVHVGNTNKHQNVQISLHHLECAQRLQHAPHAFHSGIKCFLRFLANVEINSFHVLHISCCPALFSSMIE